MKKKRKLVLRKETVQRLGASALNQVAAGTVPSGVTACYPTFYNSFCQYCVDEPIY